MVLGLVNSQVGGLLTVLVAYSHARIGLCSDELQTRDSWSELQSHAYLIPECGSHNRVVQREAAKVLGA